MILAQMKAHIKDLLVKFGRGDIYIIAIVIIVGFVSFGLGRLSKIEEYKRLPVSITDIKGTSSETVSIEALSPPPATETVIVTDIPPQSGLLVGSKNSTKYHFPWCSGAKRIKEENKVWFASAEEARANGYTPASNCKGLE